MTAAAAAAVGGPVEAFSAGACCSDRHGPIRRDLGEARRPLLLRVKAQDRAGGSKKFVGRLKGQRKPIRASAIGNNGKIGPPQPEGAQPDFSKRWVSQSTSDDPLLWRGKHELDTESRLNGEDRLVEDAVSEERHSGEDQEDEYGDYEANRRRQYREAVESGPRGVVKLLQAVGDSVSRGVSTSGRNLAAIGTGVQGRLRRGRDPPPNPVSEQDPDSLGDDSDSDTEWDGSDGSVLLPSAASAETPAVGDPEAYKQEGNDTSSSGRAGPEDTWEEPWETIKRWWNNPAFFRFRVSLSMANLTMALPAFIARVSALYPTFVTLLTGQLSLPIMAPLLFGGGIAAKAIMSNLGFVLPRLAMAGGVLWILWATNYAMQEAMAHLRNSGAIDRRISNVLVLTVELVASTIGLVTILSSVGVKISSLLLPGFAAVALAGKDVWHNYFAGFFLFAAQPFRPGDSVALLCGASVAPVTPTSAVPPGWFEGVCESVDLRYTVLRNGRQRLLVPNAHFVTREFLVTDAGPVVTRPPNVRTDKVRRGVKTGRTGSPPGSRPPGMAPPTGPVPTGQGKGADFFPTFSQNIGPGFMAGPGGSKPARGKQRG